ncbi:uncharacterized protein LOC108248990 isoform X2 [Kryptolebias marmoratus]|uniref:uncharacterized protein LOC108248990 isoform X2 n=1 Tax=Kryptolebias marmoratus TaxID=37003 RepID=UPI000D5304F5|nr:uncharacterized protein LOC108248990 isoform X2 [Kryptolebias marmoratus]
MLEISPRVCTSSTGPGLLKVWKGPQSVSGTTTRIALPHYTVGLAARRGSRVICTQSPQEKGPKPAGSTSLSSFPPLSYTQLAYPGADGNMAPFLPQPVDLNVVESQAVELDYINSTFSRGHLNPSLHHQTHACRSATFTLTNVVPQRIGSNDGPWEILEQTVNMTLSAYCLGEAYVVTGIIPYRGKGPWIKNRVAVPEYMWSAYCCPSYNHSLPEELRDSFPTFAAVGRNDQNSTEEIVPIDKTAKKQFRGYDVRQMPLKTLEMYLKDRFNTVISVFYEQCAESN